jgi:hypothetical protein
MKRKSKPNPVVFGESTSTPSGNRRQKMTSKKSTVELKVSWDNIQSWIEAGIRSMAKGKISDQDHVLKIKLDYAGGYVAGDKIIPVEVITEKGVRVISFGQDGQELREGD